MKLNSEKYPKIQQSLVGLFYWLNLFRVNDIKIKQMHIQDYRSSNCEPQQTIRMCTVNLIKALNFNKYEKNPIAKLIAQVVQVLENFEISCDILIALVNECCSIIEQDDDQIFTYKESKVRNFNGKGLSQTLKEIALLCPTLLIDYLPIWVCLRQHFSQLIRAAVFSAIESIFGETNLQKLEMSYQTQYLDELQQKLLNLLYMFRDDEQDINAQKKLIDAFLTLHEQEFVIFSNIPFRPQGNTYVMNIISQNLQESSKALQKKSIQLLGVEIENWSSNIFENGIFLNPEEIEESQDLSEQMKMMMIGFISNLEEVLTILGTLFQREIDFYINDIISVLDQLIACKMPGIEKLVLNLADGYREISKEQNKEILDDFFVKVFEGEYEFIEYDEQDEHFVALNFLKIFQNSSQFDYLNLNTLVTLLVDRLKQDDLLALEILFQDLISLAFYDWRYQEEQYLRNAAIQSLKVIASMMDAFDETQALQKKALEKLQQFLDQGFFDCEYVTALLQLFTSKYTLQTYNDPQFIDSSVISLIEELVLSSIKSKKIMRQNPFQYFQLEQALIQFFFKIHPIPYTYSKKMIPILWRHLMKNSVQDGKIKLIQPAQFCKFMVFVGTCCLEMKNLSSKSQIIFGSALIRDFKHEFTPLLRIEMMLWSQQFMLQIINLAQDYLRKFLKSMDRHDYHQQFENFLRLLMTQLTSCFSMYTFFNNEMFERQFTIMLRIVGNQKFSQELRRDALIHFSDLLLMARNTAFEMETKLQHQYTTEVEKKRVSEQERADLALRKTILRQSMNPNHQKVDKFRDSAEYIRTSSAVVSEQVTDRFNDLNQKLNDYHREALRIVQDCDSSIHIQQILLSSFAILTDRKIPGSDIVDLLLTMRSSEHSLISNILDYFLSRVRDRNPNFFTENFVKIVMSIAKKKETNDIGQQSINFILDLMVRQLQETKGIVTDKQAEKAIELILRNIEILREQGEVEVGISSLRYFKTTKKTPSILLSHFPFIKLKLSANEKKELFHDALVKLAKSCDDFETRTSLEEMAADYKRFSFFTQAVQRRIEILTEGKQNQQIEEIEEDIPEEEIE